MRDFREGCSHSRDWSHTYIHEKNHCTAAPTRSSGYTIRRNFVELGQFAQDGDEISQLRLEIAVDELTALVNLVSFRHCTQIINTNWKNELSISMFSRSVFDCVMEFWYSRDIWEMMSLGAPSFITLRSGSNRYVTRILVLSVIYQAYLTEWDKITPDNNLGRVVLIGKSICVLIPPSDFVALSALHNSLSLAATAHRFSIFAMAVTSCFVHTYPRLLFLMRVLQFCCSLGVGIGLIFACLMRWDIDDVSANLASTLLCLLVLTSPPNNITSSRIYRYHTLPCLGQLCINGFSFFDNTSALPPKLRRQTTG